MNLTFVHDFKKVTAIYQDFAAVSSFDPSKDIQKLIFALQAASTLSDVI